LLRPGSNQYPGVQRLQMLRALSSLPEVGSEDCLVLRCAGMARVVLLCQYQPLPAGEGSFNGEGVVLTLWLSPYGGGGEVPDGEAEWWPVTVMAPAAVIGGATNDVELEVARWRFTYPVPEGDERPVASFTIDLALPSYAERLRICAQELASGESAEPGAFGVYALLSLDEGGGYGWTIKSVMAPSGV
jgi:hypothetical protein